MGSIAGCHTHSSSADPAPVVLVLQVQTSQVLEAFVRLSRAVKQLQGQGHPCAGEVQQVRSPALAAEPQWAAVILDIGCKSSKQLVVWLGRPARQPHPWYDVILQVPMT